MRNLAFNMQHQLQTNWCWAAVASSVSNFYHGPNGPSGQPWQQCEIVCAELNDGSCCNDGSTPQCNKDWYLDAALTRVGHLVAASSSMGETFQFIQQAVDNGNPVGVRIGWKDGTGGHFVAITGYDVGAGPSLITVEDPYYGESTYDLASFTTGYQSGQGAWTNTYQIA